MRKLNHFSALKQWADECFYALHMKANKKKKWAKYPNRFCTYF